MSVTGVSGRKYTPENSLRLEVFNATAYFFLLTCVERTGIRSAEVTAYMTDY
jgi:hypothetical protein